MKSGTRNPFYKKKFFLDINGCPADVEKKLINDLKCLGAKEAFHCKDAFFVVSNKPDTLQNKHWTPMTANSSCHSPRVFPDSPMDLDSPESQIVDRKAIPLSNSRGKVLLQKSQQIVKKHGTMDTFAVCKKYGIKVYHIDKVLSYVKKMKHLSGAKNQDKPIVKILNKLSSSNNDVQKIRAPFVKIEDVDRQYRTRHRVFSSWANIIDPALSQSVKELHKNFAINGSVEHQILFRPILKDISVNNLHKGSPFLTPSTPSKSFTRQSTHASLAIISSTDIKKKPFQPADKKKKCEKKRQYCEICNVYYSNLSEHMESKSHLKFMDDAYNFKELEQLVAEISKLTDFRQLHLQGCGNYKSGFSTNSCHHFGEIKEPIPSNKIINLFSSESSEFETELYDLDDESIISATCSTASTGFSFLEDKWDLGVSPEIPQQNKKSCLNNQPIYNDFNLLQNLQLVTESKDLKLNNVSTIKESECQSSYLQTDGPILKASSGVTDLSKVSLSVDEEKVVSANQNDLRELLDSMSESFESCMFSKSKKRKRGEELETYMLKRFLHDDLPSHISDSNSLNEVLRDSCFYSAINCYLPQHAESGLYTSVSGLSTDSNQTVGLSTSDGCVPNLNLMLIPISVPSSSLCPPVLYKQGPPLLACNDLLDSSLPALGIELLDPQVETLTDAISNVLKVTGDCNNSFNAIENTIWKAPHMEDHLNLKCYEGIITTQIACEYEQKLSQTILEDSLVIVSEAKDNGCKKHFKDINNLIIEKLLLYRDSSLHYFSKILGTSKLIFERLLSISSKTYSSYKVGDSEQIYMFLNQKPLSGNVIFRLNEVFKEDSDYKVFIILNTYGKKITYKFIKQQLVEQSLLHHPSISKHLQYIKESLEKAFHSYSIMLRDNLVYLKKDVDLSKLNLISNKANCRSVCNAVDRSSNQTSLSCPPSHQSSSEESSDCCSFGTLCKYEESITESSVCDEEYIIVDSCSSDEMNLTVQETNDYSEEF